MGPNAHPGKLFEGQHGTMHVAFHVSHLASPDAVPHPGSHPGVAWVRSTYRYGLFGLESVGTLADLSTTRQGA